jgi:putative membrane protein
MRGHNKFVPAASGMVFLLLVGPDVATAKEQPASETLTDPRIATVALTAHEIDIERGEMALTKTKNDDVKQFAEQMVNDHKAGKQEVLDLAHKLHVRPEQSSITKSLKDQAQKIASRLRRLSGAAFDKAYIDAEVAYHQAVIDALDKTLIPNASNAEVKQALINTRPTLIGHLKHAKDVQNLLHKQAS